MTCSLMLARSIAKCQKIMSCELKLEADKVTVVLYKPNGSGSFIVQKRPAKR